MPRTTASITIGYLSSLRSLRWLRRVRRSIFRGIGAPGVERALPDQGSRHEYRRSRRVARHHDGHRRNRGHRPGRPGCERRLARTDPAWLLRLPAATSALAVPFVCSFHAAGIKCAGDEPGRIVLWLGLVGTVLASHKTLAKVRMRALASALVTLVVNLIGAGLGPLTVGVSSDVRFFVRAELNPVCPARPGGDGAVRSCALF